MKKFCVFLPDRAREHRRNIILQTLLAAYCELGSRQDCGVEGGEDEGLVATVGDFSQQVRPGNQCGGAAGGSDAPDREQNTGLSCYSDLSPTVTLMLNMFSKYDSL